MTGTKNTLINTVTKQAESAVTARHFVIDGANGVSHPDAAADNLKIYGYCPSGAEAGKDILVNPNGSPGVFEGVANGAIAIGDLLKVVVGVSGANASQNGRLVKADTAGDVVVGKAETSAAAGQLFNFTMREGVIA